MAKLGARAGRFTKLVKLLGKLRRCEELEVVVGFLCMSFWLVGCLPESDDV